MTNFTKLSDGFFYPAIRRSLLLSFFICFGLLVKAQTVPPFYNSNTGASNNAFPLNSTTSNKVQWLYSPGMFNSNGATGTPAFAGLITKVYWRLGTTASSTSTYTNFTIKLGQTVGTQTAWTSTTYATGMTTVFSQSSFQLAGAAPSSWVVVTLQTPFVYDPSKSLVFELSVTGGTGNQSAQITNNGTRRIWGPSSNPTSGTGSGTGLVDFGIDLVPLNVDVVSLTYPSSVCQEETIPVEIEIENTDVVPRNNFLVQYKIDGVVKSTETHAAFIGAGQTATYVFNVPIDNLVPGNYVLTANILGKTAFMQQNYTVKPSPLGSYVKQGSVFTGSYRSGDALDPDIVAFGDEIRYAIEPPTGYANSDYGVTWNFAFYEFITPSGTPAGSQHTKTDPVGSNDAFSSFIPVIAQSDSTYLLRYAIHSIANGCDAPIIERQVFVAPRPVSVFSASTACEGAALQFANSSSISSGSISHKWYFGNGDSSIKVNPSYTYLTAGIYTVSLVVTSDYGYSHSSSQQITIFENPSAEFGVTNVCEGSVTPFADGSIIPAGNPTYTWDFGDGSALGSGPNPTHQYTTPGVYNVTMTVSANGCSDMTTQTTTYAPRAVVDFSFPTIDCNNQLMSFSNGSTVLFGTIGSLWDFGDAGKSTAPNPSHTYAIFGSIDVSLSVTTNFGCVDQVVKTIVLKEGPKADFSIGNLCDKDDVVFTNTGSEPAGALTNYEWNFSDGMNQMSKDVTRNFPSVGTYQVSLQAFSDNGCVSTKSMSFTLEEEPVPSFFAEDVCDGTLSAFKNTSIGNQGNFSSSWDFGGGVTSTLKNPSIALPVGTHTVELTITTPGACMASLSKPVNVFAIPTFTSFEVESGLNGLGLMSLQADVTPANVAYTILWGDGGRNSGNASSGSIRETYTYLSDGIFLIRVDLDNNGCLATDKGEARVTRTGLNTVSNRELNVYPNPASGIFNLDLKEIGTENIEVTVFAADGRIITVSAEINSGIAQIDLSGAPAGVYLIKLSSEQGVYTGRVTLTH